MLLRKRQRDQSVSGDREERSTKRKAWSHNYSAQLWDSLSKIHFTRKALQEYDRRTVANQNEPIQDVRPEKPYARFRTSGPRRIKQIVRNGGPDLNELRGVSVPPSGSSNMN